MYNQNDDRVFFNQNVLFYKDNNYNSGGSLEISICNNTVDYKTFSAPTIHISVIGESNLRRLCTLNYVNTVDLYNSIKYIIQNIETIYATNKNNVLNKKYQFDRTLKFEFIEIKDIQERVVAISVIFNSSDFTKVVVPYTVFCAFAIGILKYFVNEFVDITFAMSTRNLMTEILEQNKLIRNGISVLPSSIFEIDNKIKGGVSNPVAASPIEIQEFSESDGTAEILDDFDKFLGKDMENIVVDDLESKAVVEEKKNNNEIKSPFVTKTLTNDLSILESMLTSAVTRPDPMISMFEGFRRSMNLDETFTFLPEISREELKSVLYISKLTHDSFLNSYISKNKAIPSGFPILKYKLENLNNIDSVNTQICYDLLLISGFIKVFRNRMESRESDINKNGSLFYMRIRNFLDPLIYSFIDGEKGKIISTILCSNFETYSTNLGFFDHYQRILTQHDFKPVSVDDIREFCNELNDKIFTKGVLSINISDRHDSMFKSGLLRIKIDNKLSIEQIINELVPLEVLERNGVDLKEGSPDLQKVIENYSISEDVLNIFLRKEIKEEKVKTSNISKTVRFYNDEVPETYRNEFFEYIDKLNDSNYDFKNSPFEVEELGENIIKALYIWNESDNKKELLTSYRSKLEECLLTKELILAKYMNTEETVNNEDSEWNLDFFND